MHRRARFYPIMLVLVLFGAATVRAQDVNSNTGDRVVVVDSIESFLSAIDNNTTILMRPGLYDIAGVEPHQGRKYEVAAFGVGDRDEWELEILDVSNLRIQSFGPPGSVHLVNSQRYADVVQIYRSTGVTIDGLVLGHFPDPGHCRGGVLRLIESENIRIRDSRLHGSGIIGLAVRDSEVILVESVIERCSETAMSIGDESSVQMIGGALTLNTGEFFSELVSVGGASRLELAGTSVVGNIGTGHFEEPALFWIEDGSEITINDCPISDNAFPMLKRGDGTLRIDGTVH